MSTQHPSDLEHEGPRADAVASREGLVAFALALAKQARTEEVENPSTHRYLHALARWTGDCDANYAFRGEELPELSPAAWRLVARMLDAALVYE